MRIHREERERESRDTGRGRSRPHAGGLTWDPIPVSRITPWAEGSAKLLSPPGIPETLNHRKQTEGCWRDQDRGMG